jgi:hypothetical protein
MAERSGCLVHRCRRPCLRDRQLHLFTTSTGMAKNRNPQQSHSSPAGKPRQERPAEPELPLHDADAEGDISLDDYQEKNQARPRLPDQRRETPSREMGGGTAAAPRDQAPEGSSAFETNSHTAAWKPASRDEIADYDLSAPGDEGLTVEPPVKQPAARKEVAREESAPQPAASRPLAELDDLDEFIARAANSIPQEKEEKVRRPYSLVEKVSLGVGCAILVGFGAWLLRSATSAANSDGKGSRTWPDLPMKGEVITVSEAASGWRKRAESDRVAQMEVLLPAPGLKMPEVIPQVTFTIDGSASKDGYLRFIFKDSDGRPRGDTRVIHVAGGKLADLGKGEIIKSATEATIYGSYGLLDSDSYYTYASSPDPRWSVEVAESPSYDADDKDWKVLDTFNVRNELVR